MLSFNLIYLVIALFVATLSYFNSFVFAYIILKPLSTLVFEIKSLVSQALANLGKKPSKGHF